MMPLLVALFAHWVADFPVQALGHRHMGRKHESLAHLATHVFGYACAFSAVFWLHEPFALASTIAAWIGLNAVLHAVIDFWTSKATHACWRRGVSAPQANVIDIDQRWVGPFFSIIGFDQFLHVAFMAWSGSVLGVL